MELLVMFTLGKWIFPAHVPEESERGCGIYQGKICDAFIMTKLDEMDKTSEQLRQAPYQTKSSVAASLDQADRVSAMMLL